MNADVHIGNEMIKGGKNNEKLSCGVDRGIR